MKNINLTYYAIFLLSTFFHPAYCQEDPCSAPLVYADGSCTVVPIAASTNGASGVANPSCGSYLPTAKDMWYRVVVPASANMRFNINQAAPWTIWNAAVAVYRPTGSCPTLGLTQVGCANTGGSMARLNLTAPTIVAGETLYVRAFEENGDLGNMDLCILDMAPVAPANDNPCGAIAISNVGAYVYSHNNGAATSTTDRNGTAIPAPGCNFSNNDVWYKTAVPSSGSLQITLQNGTMNGNIAAYRRTTPCAGFTLIRCDAERGLGTNAELNLLGLTPGDTIYIRVYRHSGGSGTFTLTTQDLDIYNTKSNDCATAKEYCGEQIFYQHLFGAGEDNDATMPGLGVGCLADERNTMWMKFDFYDTTTFRFTIRPLYPVDYDWALYGPIGPGQPCGDLGAPIRCSFTQPNAAAATYEGDNNYTGMHANANDVTEGNASIGDFVSGDGYVRPVQVTDAMLNGYFYLRIDNWTQDPSGFQLDFHGTDQPSTCVSVLGTVLGYNNLKLEASTLGNNHLLAWDALPENTLNAELLWRTADSQWQHLHNVLTIPQRYVHSQPATGVKHYYRIQATQDDGNVMRSNVCILQSLPAGGQTTAYLYPNPSSGPVQLHITSPDAWDKGSLTIIDMTGRTILTQHFALAPGSQSLGLDLSTLATGPYIVRLMCPDRIIHLPLRKF